MLHATPTGRIESPDRPVRRPWTRARPPTASGCRKLVGLAMLGWQCAGAQAAGLLEVTQASGLWVASTRADLGELGAVIDISNPGAQALLPGVPLANASLSTWSRPSDTETSSWHSTGTLKVEQSLTYTLADATPGLASLGLSGRGAATGQWMLVDGAGHHVPGTSASYSNAGSQALTLRLSEPADLRLAGLLWQTSLLDAWTFSLSFTPEGGAAQVLVTRDALPATESIEYQWRMPAAGVLNLYVALADLAEVPCCDVQHNAAGGWELTLEASALAPVPEPAAVSLLLTGLLALRLRRGFATAHQEA